MEVLKMINREALEKAVKKADENGWGFNDWKDVDDFEWRVGEDEYGNICLIVCGMGDVFYWTPSTFIFDRDFAKALWPEGLSIERSLIVGDYLQPVWQYHLQQIVIAKNRLQYLGENI